MIDIAEVQAAAYRIAKVGTSGYDTTPEFIQKANEVQLDALNILSPHYGHIQAIDDILNFLVVEDTPTFVSGIMQLPAAYFQFIGMYKTLAGGNGDKVPLRKIKTNGIGTVQANSIRKRTIEAPGYYFRGNALVLLPSNADVGLTRLYMRRPAAVDITTAPVENGEDDYVSITSQTNYEWPDRVKNLLIYLLVQRLGTEMKEPILYEISQLGIQQNLTINPVQE